MDLKRLYKATPGTLAFPLKKRKKPPASVKGFPKLLHLFEGLHNKYCFMDMLIAHNECNPLGNPFIQRLPNMGGYRTYRSVFHDKKPEMGRRLRRKLIVGCLQSLRFLDIVRHMGWRAWLRTPEAFVAPIDWPPGVHGILGKYNLRPWDVATMPGTQMPKSLDFAILHAYTCGMAIEVLSMILKRRESEIMHSMLVAAKELCAPTKNILWVSNAEIYLPNKEKRDTMLYERIAKGVFVPRNEARASAFRTAVIDQEEKYVWTKKVKSRRASIISWAEWEQSAGRTFDFDLFRREKSSSRYSR